MRVQVFPFSFPFLELVHSNGVLHEGIEALRLGVGIFFVRVRDSHLLHSKAIHNHINSNSETQSHCLTCFFFLEDRKLRFVNKAKKKREPPPG